MKYSILLNSIFTGHERSIKAKKNIFFAFVMKGMSIAISLILVPLTLNYVDVSRYGIWLTLSSIIGWLAFFDIGLTQGLRNKFAEALAKKNVLLAQKYVSTTYALLLIIFVILWILFIIINQFLDWSMILNVGKNYQQEISLVVIIVFTYFCLEFILRIITTLLIANQEPAKASFITLIGQLLSLGIIFLLVKTTEGSLINLTLAFCLAPIVVLSIANLFFFKGSFYKYRPHWRYIDFSYSRDLFNLGVVFFIIQFANILQFQTASIIIARNFGTEDVAAYNIVYKYFGVLIMVFTIFLTPFWSASTEAYLKKDTQWIKNGIKKYNQLNILIILVGFLMLFLSPYVYNAWLGKGKVEIDFLLSLFGFLFFNTSVFGGKYVSFLNGISALRIQFIACLISPLVYIGLSIIFIKYCNMGVYSIFIAAILANFNTYILAPIQYNQIINKGKQGIWVR